MMSYSRVTKTRIIILVVLCALFIAEAQSVKHLNINTNNSLGVCLQRLRELYQTKNERRHEVDLSCFGQESCPPWFYQSNKDADCKCKCGNSLHYIIHCNEKLQTSAVLDCYCVTFDEKRNATVTGACYYNCENIDKKGFDLVYHTLPKTLSELNEFMCGRFNRTGRLCGECVDGTFPLAYSYNLSCVECPDGHKNWWKVIVSEFLPLTVFYFMILFFKINATSSHMHGYVLFSQAVSIPVLVRIILPALFNIPRVQMLAKVIVAFYGIWNLDFFRVFVPNVCLRATTLQILTLDYAIAVYPLFLMAISYTMIELHDRNFKAVVFIWKPFRFIFTFFRRNWDCRTSVIDAYATFFVLSFMKFLSVSFDILTPAHLQQLNSKDITLVVYYDGSIDYFGKEHLPYAILAIIILILFIAVPLTVLFLYPFKFFQNFLSCFPVRWHILHIFADSFLGCYKDGSEPGTRDCRYFAVLFFVARILSFLIYASTVSSTYFNATIVLWLLFAIMITIAQPFKEVVNYYTKINLFYILLLVIVYTSIAGIDIAEIKDIRFYKPFIVLTTVFVVTPLFYISFITIHWLYTQRKWGKDFIVNIQAWRQGYDWWSFESDSNFEDSLPDRLVHPDQYHEGNLSLFTSLSVNNASSTIATY